MRSKYDFESTNTEIVRYIQNKESDMIEILTESGSYIPVNKERLKDEIESVHTVERMVELFNALTTVSSKEEIESFIVAGYSRYADSGDYIVSKRYRFIILWLIFCLYDKYDNLFIDVRKKPNYKFAYEKLLARIARFFNPSFDKSFSTVLGRYLIKTKIFHINIYLSEDRENSNPDFLSVYSTLVHELVHVDQMRKSTPFFFYIKYFFMLPVLFTLRGKYEMQGYITELCCRAQATMYYKPSSNSTELMINQNKNNYLRLRKIFRGSTYIWMDPFGVNVSFDGDALDSFRQMCSNMEMFKTVDPSLFGFYHHFYHEILEINKKIYERNE